jgi:hypothetical protein
MVADKNVPVPPPPRVLVSGDVPRFPDEPRVHRSNDESASRMNNEVCPNESPSVDDGAGYPQEEEEP